jgi:nicotinate-nucleotide adenylyltransferase
MNIALFGGTFDPPHCGHLQIAEAAVLACQLDKVIFLPCHQSPHKAAQPSASGQQRLEMLQLATAERPWAEVSDWEIKRSEPSFSWQTAEHFTAQFPLAKLYWLLGEDQWCALDRWSRPERLAELLTFIVFPRAGRVPTANPRFRARFLTAEFPGRATDIRTALQAGSGSGNLPAGVAQYIADQKLYRAASQPLDNN